MQTRRRVYLAQYASPGRRTQFLPLAIGMLAAHAKGNDEFDQAYEIVDLLIDRDEPATLAAAFERPDIIGFSLYMWNQRLSLAVAQEVKRLHPNATIIAGGPSVPVAAEGFLIQHPYLDFLVHGEGEVAFLDLCLERLRRNVLDKVPGLSFRCSNGIVTTAPRQRVKSLDELCSPFLDGTFDELLNRTGYSFSAIWETNRGCPFGCAFCYWGANLRARVTRYSDDRLKRELEWMANRRITAVYAADANFGISDRDYEIAHIMAELKRKTGYPKTFLTNYLKNSNDRVFRIASLLHKEHLCQEVTLSLQSVDPRVLSNINRSNIKLSTFRQLGARYREAGIPTCTELILGLPGETLQSFVAGLDETVLAGEHDNIYVYLCRILPNTEMAELAHRRQFGIRTITVPVVNWHEPLGHCDPLPEAEEIVVATDAMPHVDWCRARRHVWFMDVFILMKVGYLFMLYLVARHGLKPFDLSVDLQEHIKAGSLFPVLAREIVRVDDHSASTAASGVEVNDQDLPTQLRGLRWPVEEVSFLLFSISPEAVIAELRELAACSLRKRRIAVDEEILDELALLQTALIVKPKDNERLLEFAHDWQAFMCRAKVGKASELVERRTAIRVKPRAEFRNIQEFAIRQVWLGRGRRPFLQDFDRVTHATA